MTKSLLLTLLLCGGSLAASAQKVSGMAKGALQDSVSASPLADATVSVMRLPDSTLVSFTLTNNNGQFEIKNLSPGEYAILSSYIGLRSFRRSFTISASNPVADFGTVRLQRADKLLDEVVITEAPVRVSGDTISYKADAFKTKPNATVEDLLKKLPGVQVERDGTVKAQGENVQKVYVDGKEFFGNDPKLATKNLTADMVDRVDVYDDMSEQAKFNGIDDGSRAKAINLKLKKDKKKGVFGRAYAGYGSGERYDAGITTNYFKGAMQANVIAKSNNTNNQSYTMTDMLGMFSGGGPMAGGGNSNMGAMGGAGGMMTITPGGAMGGLPMGRSGTTIGGFNPGGSSGGITTSSQAGLNYRDTWSKSFDINGSYFYNRAQLQNQRNAFRQTFLSDTATIFNRNNTAVQNTNHNHRLNLNAVYAIDSFNSLVYQPALNVQNTRLWNNDSLINRFNDRLLNQGRTTTDSRGDGHTWSNSLIWRHKFRRVGRTLAVTFFNSWGVNDRETNVQNDLTLRKSDQLVRSQNKATAYNIGVSYTEPLARDKILELNYTHNTALSLADRQTLNRNPLTGKYDLQDDLQTNRFENTTAFDRFGTNLRIVKKKYNYQLGFAVQQTSLESRNLTKNTVVPQKATNLFPMATFNYNFQRSRSLRFSYRGRTVQPTANQLQEVLNKDNFPYTYIGNASLRQEFNHSLMLSYNFFNAVKFRNLFASLTYNNSQNRISNSITTNAFTGEQLTRPVNVGGVFNLNANVNVGFPIRRLLGGNLQSTSRVGYAQDVNVADGRTNYNRNLSLGEDLRLNFNHKEKLDMGLTAGVTYNRVQNTVQTQNNAAFFTYIYGADINYLLPGGFSVATDLDYTFNTGLAQGFNQNFALWNASLAKQLFKNKRGEIRAAVYDLLNQNTSVFRTAFRNYIEDVQNTVLRRYFLLSFTLNINRMGGRSVGGPMRGRSIRVN